MSYILVAWEQPIPRAMEDVAPLLRTLRGDKAMVSSPRVDKFMARLWEKYPRDLDDEDGDYIWDDSFPFAPQPRPRLIHLGISFSHIDEVMPFVLKIARETGLVVYDSEAGTVFLPTDSFLGNPPLPPKQPVAKAFDVKATERELVDLMAAVFAPLGFKWVKIQAWDSRFVRKFIGGWQSITPKINVEPDLGLVDVDYLLAAYLDAADPLMGVETGTAKAADAFVGTTFLSGFVAKTGSDRLRDFERSRSHWVLRSTQELARFAKVSGDMIVKDLLPRLDNYRSMADYGHHVLDRVARNEPPLLSEPTIVRLAAIAAAAPDRFDEMVHRELSAFDARITEVQAMSPPRPRQVAAEQALRARIETFADKFRETRG
jgi:hypothetical protein